jgi:hypothetical protein
MQSARIHDLLQLGPGERVILLRDAPASDEIARLIASLANTHGGTIVFGARSARAVGGVGDPQAALSRIAHAAERVRPSIVVEPQIAALDGHTLILLDVPQGRDAPYVGPDGGVLVRKGRWSIAAPPEQARELARRAIDNAMLIPLVDRDSGQRLQAKNATASIDIEHLLDKLERLIVANAELTGRLDRASAWRARLTDQAIGAALGFIVSVLVYLIGIN